MSESNVFHVDFNQENRPACGPINEREPDGAFTRAVLTYVLLEAVTQYGDEVRGRHLASELEAALELLPEHDRERVQEAAEDLWPLLFDRVAEGS